MSYYTKSQILYCPIGRSPFDLYAPISIEKAYYINITLHLPLIYIAAVESLSACRWLYIRMEQARDISDIICCSD